MMINTKKLLIYIYMYIMWLLIVDRLITLYIVNIILLVMVVMVHDMVKQKSCG